MSGQDTEMGARGVVRHSNAQAKRITMECIEGALIQLLEAREMEKISISEIVRRAGVSRTAFYAHYRSKEDVLRRALGDTIRQIDRVASGDPRSEAYWARIFAETRALAAPFRLLLKAGLGEQILSEITEQMLSGAPDDAPSRYREIFWTGAIYNLLSRWIASEAPEPPEEMAKICARIVRFAL